MSFDIRKIETADFQMLPQLFNHRKSPEFISWLYSHPNHDERSAYVAIDDNQLIGAIGYVRQPYWVDGVTFNGLIPLSWEVKKEKRGLAGLKLLFKVLNDSDFYLGLDGSADMKSIFNQLGFKKIGEARGVQKVLMPYRYLKTLNRVGVRDVTRLFRDSYKKVQVGNIPLSSTVLRGLDIHTYQVATCRAGTFSNSISKGHLEWLNRMPGTSLHLFEIEDNGTTFGPVVVLIKNFKRGLCRASILHIPPFECEHESLLLSAIGEVEQFLVKQNVTAVTILSSDELLDKVLNQRGFVFERKSRPIVVKGPRALVDKIETQKVYISYIESDKSVRNI